MEINKVTNAYKWSTITEAVAKLITPITNIVLARILVPEMFGIVATIDMVISFMDIFTDAGFQKYIIQHEYDNVIDKNKQINVAFTSNLFLSLLLWWGVFIKRIQLSSMVGAQGLEKALVVAAISLPINSFSSMQIAYYRREFKFKGLFYVRIIGLLIPVIITIPLAIIQKNYWSIIIGTLAGNIANALFLSIQSEWKPKLYFEISIFIKMFKYSFWILIESIIVWFSSYIGILVITNKMSPYYVGIYKTSITTVNQVFSLVTAATSNVLFSSLSRKQTNYAAIHDEYCRFIKVISILVIPLGFGIFLCKDLVTFILLGSQWGDCVEFIGMWGLISAFSLIYGTYCNGVYNAIGKPQYSVLANGLQVIMLVPAMNLAVSGGYEMIWKTRCFLRVFFIISQIILMKKCVNILPVEFFKETIIPNIGAVIMLFMGKLIINGLSMDIIWSEILIIPISIIIYFIIILIFPQYRRLIRSILNKSLFILK